MGLNECLHISRAGDGKKRQVTQQSEEHSASRWSKCIDWDCRVFRNASLPLLPFTSVARQPTWYSFGKLDKAELVYFRLAKRKIKIKQHPKIINLSMSASTLQWLKEQNGRHCCTQRALQLKGSLNEKQGCCQLQRRSVIDNKEVWF